MPRPRRPHKLERDFYTRTDTLLVARELLGKRLVVPAASGVRVSGRIVEVEAYLGVEDRAAHSYKGRRTARTETMYSVGGTVYVFFVYGMHHQFNVVAGPEGRPHAILVRAVEPEEGEPLMRERRPVTKERELTSGPGKLCKALGIDRSFDGEDLTTSRRVWLEETGEKFTPEQIATGPRIGVAYAADDALKPWRLWLKSNVYVSKK
ncbi:MAG: DNA-3-methyladenine glycosylase [Acidobacteriota bacterium]|jgi:DNA-3-methyladenine glycosylase|nr:DNA-3-methyladenine glycosylase [Acidobacteriota bacterium]